MCRDEYRRRYGSNGKKRAVPAAALAEGGHAARCFVTCVVRLSSEKNAMLFAELLEPQMQSLPPALQRMGALMHGTEPARCRGLGLAELR